ncbi:MAG: response regulator transcription factor [Chitinispirillia bacterium]|nr:response regulator transcription factor [Chitinispirillia bacterium]MCL2269619.1 response regulator transcription factor [Chitinispirillia bacterium]
MATVLLVDDNDEILEANRACLAEQGLVVECADTGIKALDCLRSKRYDCIVLDILLPDLDGFAICKAARTLTDVPILFLSCLEETADKVKGLTAGGDDYMAKPYSLEEFCARVQALMRRGERLERDKLSDGFYVDRENRLIHALGKTVFLTEREFMLFELLHGNPGVQFSNENLLNDIWQGNAGSSAVKALASRLRQKIEFAEEVLGRVTTYYGAGYCLTPPRSGKQ